MPEFLGKQDVAGRSSDRAPVKRIYLEWAYIFYAVARWKLSQQFVIFGCRFFWGESPSRKDYVYGSVSALLKPCHFKNRGRTEPALSLPKGFSTTRIVFTIR